MTAASIDWERPFREAKINVQRFGLWFAASVVLLGPLSARFFLMTRPPLDRHAFRQTQTLFTAAIYSRDGISLLHPQTPVYGKPWEIPFEFPLFQAIVALFHNATGASISTSGRVVAFLSYLGCGIALFHVIRKLGISRRVAFVALSVFNATPYLVVWSVAALIEWFSVLLVLGGCLLSDAVAAGSDKAAPSKWITKLGPVLMIGLWALAGAVKITTVVALSPIALLLIWPKRRARRTQVAAAVSLLSALIGALIWTAHADGIKAQSFTTSWTTSKALTLWTFGTFEQRMMTRNWQVLGIFELSALTPLLLLCVLLIIRQVVMLRGSKGATYGLLGLFVLVGPLVFFNLFIIHDYYSCEIVPVAIVVCALFLNRLAGREVLAFIVVALSSNILTAPYAQVSFGPTAQYNGGSFVRAANLVEARCPKGNVVVIADDWDPSILYLSSRQGFMANGDERAHRFARDPNLLDRSYSCAVGPAVKGLPAYLAPTFSGRVVTANGYTLYLRPT